MDDQQIETMIQEKGLTAPRITPEHIESVIQKADYHVFPGTQLTVCCLTLNNGFTVTGESACASPENFDEEVGREIAYSNAFEKIWMLEGYLLKERLAEQARFVERVARIAHEINAAYCQSLGDDSQASWRGAPDWQKESAIQGVLFHLDNPDAGASASHNSWMAQKETDGWVYGEVKDPEKKTHPCMVSFEQLPVEQQAKDYLFKQVVHSMK